MQHLHSPSSHPQPGVTAKIFRSFGCKAFEDGNRCTTSGASIGLRTHLPSPRSYLIADLGMHCGDAPEYRFLRLYAIIAAVVFSLGTPLLYLALLCRHWNRGGPSALEPRTGSDVADLYHRDDREDVAHLDFLFGSYKPSFWWFEVRATRAPRALLARR